MAQVRYLESADLVLYLQLNPKITIVNPSTKNKWRLMWGLPCPAHCGYTTVVRQTNPELDKDDKELRI